MMTAKEYLGQVEWLGKQIEGREAELKRLRQLKKGGAGAESEGTQRIEALETEIEQDILRLVERRRAIAEIIASVEDPRLRTLLELRYLSCMNWDSVAESMHYERRQITRLHNAALSALKMDAASTESCGPAA